MRFAGEFDPQYMHVDEEKANQERFDGIKWCYSLCIFIKLYIVQFYSIRKSTKRLSNL
ncbi:hypothetical protein [Priestia megaterium]|uniref:hypothetical protein n=1 Tax=Priestia megaterium TaxID=1404 RepID=UPI003C7257C2